MRIRNADCTYKDSRHKPSIFKSQWLTLYGQSSSLFALIKGQTFHEDLMTGRANVRHLEIDIPCVSFLRIEVTIVTFDIVLTELLVIRFLILKRLFTFLSTMKNEEKCIIFVLICV